MLLANDNYQANDLVGGMGKAVISQDVLNALTTKLIP